MLLHVTVILSYCKFGLDPESNSGDTALQAVAPSLTTRPQLAVFVVFYISGIVVENIENMNCFC